MQLQTEYQPPRQLEAPIKEELMANEKIENETKESEMNLEGQTLEAAASEWKPDSKATEAAETVETPAQAPSEISFADLSSEPVTMISDPFQLNTVEVGDAQQISEELEIDGDLEEAPAEAELEPTEDVTFASPEETQEQLDRLSEVMAKEHAKQQEKIEELNEETAEEAAQRLAAEIAEDEAIARELEAQADPESLALADPELEAALPKHMETTDENLDLSELQSCIEALLFMSDKPLSPEKLRDLLGPEMALHLFQEAITGLCDRYRAAHHGFELVEIGGGYQFRTKPGRAALAKKLAKVQTQKLSSGAMETLAITAYKQPVMKEDIDKIRGVDSSHFIRTLLDRKLIRISGRSELPGRPMLYSTTDTFLEVFGLGDLSAMPPLRELEQMVPASQANTANSEDPRVAQMRRLVGEMTGDTSITLKYDPKEDERILKEMREKVSAIPTSTPYLDQQKELEKQAKAEAEAAQLAALSAQPEPELQLPPQ